MFLHNITRWLVVAAYSGLVISCMQAEEAQPAVEGKLRLATYNISLYGKSAGKVAERLASGNDAQAKSIAAIIQTVRPDILLLNEIDHEPEMRSLMLLRDQYLAVARDGREAIEYPFVYSAPSNTGINSGLDLNLNSRLGEPDDAWGYGVYPGQYSFAVLSRFPIDEAAIRTFQTFAWSKLPGALRPIDPKSQSPYHPDNVWAFLRLSSKNHVDLPIEMGNRIIHVLASHPTPPVFDGPEDRNGCRNHDEIIFWKHYVEGEASVVDDSGKAGGLGQDASFVVMGDLNSDPAQGGSRPEAIRSLLQHPRITDPLPRRLSISDSTVRSEIHSTADFGSVGRLRVDYVLPSSDLKLLDAKVYWPAKGEPGSTWIHASDHRLVWVDVLLPMSVSRP